MISYLYFSHISIVFSGVILGYYFLMLSENLFNYLDRLIVIQQSVF